MTSEQLNELERRVRAAEDHAQQVSTFAAKMIGHACERHADTIQKMSFNEFYSEMPRSCHWCADERVTALEAERDRLAAEVERLRALLQESPDA